MIFDTLKHAQLYEKMHTRFQQGFDFLRNEDLSSLAPGRHEIDGDIFALVQEYDTIPLEQGKWETHRVYIDIQYVQEGEELFGVVNSSRLTPTVPYDSERDLEFLSGEGNLVKFLKGDILILYPHDAHMGTIAVDGKSAKVKKVIVKVRV